MRSRVSPTFPFTLRNSFGGTPVWATLGLIAIAGYCWLMIRALGSWSYDTAGALLILPVLLAIGIPVIVAVTRNDDPPLTNLILVAFVAKLASSLLRHQVSSAVYGTGDAFSYDQRAAVLAQSYNDGTITLLDLLPRKTGTVFIEHLLGTLYTVTGPTLIGGFLVFSFIGFFGLLLFYRAALIAVPELDSRRYALLLFFLPSLLFWPSSIGKEAVMLVGLGLASYGLARMLARLPAGYLVFALGALLTYYVRPHVTVILLAAAGTAFVLRRGSSFLPGVGVAVKVVAFLAISAGLTFAVSSATELLGLPTTGDEGSAITSALDETTRRTDEGGSVIEPVRVNSPADYPQAVLNVLVRPFLWEARSPTVLISALESTLLLALVALSWRRLLGVPRLLLARPYITYGLVFSMLFVLAFASVGNLGILARQRTQTLPLLLLVLALPLPATPAPVATVSAAAPRRLTAERAT